MGLGEKIHQLRKERNMTLEELGNKVGVGKSTVRKWENGMIQNMRRDKIAALAKVFGITPTELLEWDNENSSYEETENNEIENNDNHTYYLNERTIAYAQMLYENKDLALLFDAAKDASPEDLQTVHTMLQALKNKEQN